MKPNQNQLRPGAEPVIADPVCSACQREFAILITEYGALCAACLRVGYDAAVAQGDDATEQLGGMYTDQNGKVYRGN